MVLLSGVIFGFGLSLATMIQPKVVLSFLRLRDFGLLLVLGGAAFVTLLAYQLAPKLMKKPVLEAKFGKHSSVMNQSTLVGAAIFGVGWGIAGVCPGPAIAGLGTGNWPLLISVAAMAAGAYVQGRFNR
jgi:hypothetical protein